AQIGPGGTYGPGGGNSGGNDNNNNGIINNGGIDNNGFDAAAFLSSRQKPLVAHGVLASLAFVVFFPVGSIMIRIGSFRGLWIAHGIFQIFAYLVYTAAFGIGLWMIQNVPVNLIGYYHHVIGIVVFCVLFFQPILGLMHHYQFKKYNRRTLWSFGHLWLGRLTITLGMINGGLGMLLATTTGFFVLNTGHVIAYGVGAGVMWLAWVVAAVYGERKRARSRREA
ncbi:hypothetical protein K504DRAFT_344523, partial [Pleomassaria siparia CBS 279.74]